MGSMVKTRKRESEETLGLEPLATENSEPLWRFLTMSVPSPSPGTNV
jgi:hypothetical protein